MPKERKSYAVTNVLVAGRRLSGDVMGVDEKEAVKRFVAGRARTLGVSSIPSAISDALRAGGYQVTPTEARAAADKLLRGPDDYTDWPAMGWSAQR